MLDAITLDQLRVFIAVADTGSFSAAARHVGRAQSAVSHAIAQLENQLDLQLFERTGKAPILSEHGKTLLASARRVVQRADSLRRLAQGLAQGLEASISICVDAIFPVDALAEVCQRFQEKFPTVSLDIHTEVLAAVAARIIDGTCQLGILNPVALGGIAAGQHQFTQRYLGSVSMIPVAAPTFPLVQRYAEGVIPTQVLQEYRQIILGERGSASTAAQGVFSLRPWRVVDLQTKHTLLRAGLGWGNMPAHVVADDLAANRLVTLHLAAWGTGDRAIQLVAAYLPTLAMGPALRWFLDELSKSCQNLQKLQSHQPEMSAMVQDEDLLP